MPGSSLTPTPLGLEVILEQLLENEDITRMDWPAFSRDLNPIEHVWALWGDTLPPPEKTPKLKQMLIEE
ncbi:hypothetical protein TNCV_4987001 [Trichonephila clavipes]|nr:hypothetical protein TNCV_4987001 [Trichonephila clavipes]